MSFSKPYLRTALWIVAAVSIVSAVVTYLSDRSSPSLQGDWPTLVKLIASPWPQESTSKIAAGKFLVAASDLIDPRFTETVVLLLVYDVKGAMGLIINRETPVKLSGVLPQLGTTNERDSAVFIGGPVSSNSLLLLLRSAEPLDNAKHVFDDVYASANRELLAELTTRSGLRRYRPYVGYAGWGPGQLENEVETGSWHILPASADTVFDPSPGEVWRRLIRQAAVWFARSHGFFVTSLRETQAFA